MLEGKERWWYCCEACSPRTLRVSSRKAWSVVHTVRRVKDSSEASDSPKLGLDSER